MIKHAILGTDFSKAVSEIVENSEILKSIGITKISLIHVLNLRDEIMVEKFTIGGLEKKLEEQKKLLLKKGFEVTSKLVYGIPYIELEKMRKAAGAGITIIGSHGRTSPSSTIGGTAADVLHNIKAPVLVFSLKKKETEEESGKSLYGYEFIMQQVEKHEPDWELRTKDLTGHVLIPTDFSDFSEAAFQLIKNQNIKIPKVTLIHIQDEVKIGDHLKQKLDEFNKIDTERLYRLKNALATAHPEAEVEIKLQYGKPTEQILKFIKENNVTLTVMGSQGRGFFSEIFIGSVSYQVARKSNSHVLIVPVPRN